jgi:hypothetical protein
MRGALRHNIRGQRCVIPHVAIVSDLRILLVVKRAKSFGRFLTESLDDFRCTT